MSERRIVITGMGAVTPFGNGVGALREGLFAGRSTAGLITQFDASTLPTRFAAQVPLTDDELERAIENRKATKTMSRAARFAAVAAAEAMRQADLQPDVDSWRFGTCIGTGGLGFFDVDYSSKLLDIFLRSVRLENGIPSIDPAELRRNTLEMVHPLTPLKALPNILTAHLAIEYQARGPCQTVTTACTSAAQAVGEAMRIMRSGAADVMLSGGSDSMVNPNGLVAFSSLSVISKNNEEYLTASRPFDARRDGFMIGEGAAVFVLETLEHCRERGGRPLAELLGYGSSCDAFRLTDPPPDGRGCIHAMRLALADAGLPPTRLDYINAHGTGTRMNDATESAAIRTVYDGAGPVAPVSSTKSMIGHLVAAAGAVELAACLLTLEQQTLHPTINYEVADPACDLDYVPNTARPATVRTLMSNSFGFGGQNASLVVGHAGDI